MKFGSINSGLYALFLAGGGGGGALAELKCAVGSSHPKRKQWEGEVEGERMCVLVQERGNTTMGLITVIHTWVRLEELIAAVASQK